MIGVLRSAGFRDQGTERFKLKYIYNMSNIIAGLLMFLAIYSLNSDLNGQERNLLRSSITKDKFTSVFAEKQNFTIKLDRE